MEKFEKIPSKEKIVCRICGGGHPTYACKEKVDVEAKRKEYVGKLKKGESDVVELMKEAQREGSADIEIKKEETQGELLRGRPQEVEKRKEALYKGKAPGKNGDGN